MDTEVPLHTRNGNDRASGLSTERAPASNGETTLHAAEAQSSPGNPRTPREVTDIYRSSPALGRYFCKAEIFVLRNSTVIADFHLEFNMPEEQQDQLRKFILSREMVYNVFRQSLYDQEPPSSGSLYIDPLSLNMV
ncbi:hypothetical protein INR49_021350 [Caranx melampygus]|nr:hypothetical protein INR49_021350 [Caranx melampygus]